MVRLLAALGLAGLCAGAAFLIDGTQPFGRLALRAGMPELALPLLKEPHWRGLALYRAGRFEEAAASLRRAGSAAYTERGNALARGARYREALEIYDARLYAAPHDSVARANRQLVAALVPPLVAEGAAPPESGGKKLEVERQPKIQEQAQVRKSFEDQLIPADQQWLATLPDEPGRYLKLRIAAEQERRQRDGIAVPQDSNPW